MIDQYLFANKGRCYASSDEHVRGWYTFSVTLSNESGESTAKQMRMTCESG